MTDRTALALAACEGLTNEELAQRGAGGFKYTIERKRAYARAARHMHATLHKLVPAAAAQAMELAAIKTNIEAIEQMDKPVEDVSQAAELLANLKKG